MFKTIGQDVQLWPHQRQALKFLTKHFRGQTDPCLIRMPTGTGKTGIIACASLLGLKKGRTLVLTPWSNLRDQMVRALQTGFWESVGRSSPAGFVTEILPSTTERVLKLDPKVLVCTFSTLTELRRTKRALYDQLASFIELVIVDECHYEPAVEWGKAVKGLNSPTILLTATPYRNDLKLFRIRSNSNAVYHFTHKDAVAQGIIRQLHFLPLNQGPLIAKMSLQFAQIWKQATAGEELSSEQPRAIICCATAVDIRETVAALETAGIRAVGIHETFVGATSANLVKDVPDLTIQADVWVHQNKLTEGLDDHRFCCLAFFCQINNDRKLIQQIGRVLRTNPRDRKGRPALVLAPPEGGLDGRWNAYLRFEQIMDDLTSDRYRKYIENLLSQQPDVEYFDGRFRKRFDPSALSSDPQVSISPSVLVRAVQQHFTFEDYIEECTDSLNLSDAVILGVPDGPCIKSPGFALWVYASIGNSRLLSEASLYEVRLEAHCVVYAKGHILVSDTTGTYPEDLLENATSPVGTQALSGLVGEAYRLTEVSVSCAIPFDTVLRSSELRAHNLGVIPTSLTDRIHICKSVRGTSTAGRRYLGLQRGRVRQEVAGRLRREYSASVFAKWANSIATALSFQNVGHSALKRYMQTATPPDVPQAVAMAVDLGASEIQLTDSDGSSLQIVSSTVALTPKGTPGLTFLFECDFAFRPENDFGHVLTLPVTVEYQPNKGRFWLKSSGPTGVKVEVSGDDRPAKSFTDFVNQNQDLLLIGLDGGNLVYQARNFYAVDYQYAEQSLLRRIERPAIGPCSSEKGSKSEILRAKEAPSKVTRFFPGSLFELIANSSLPLAFVPELVLCEDLGSECADFVLANFTSRQIALVHAKAASGAGISASSFHDVVAQAMKNLVYLTRNAEQPKGVGSWCANSKWSKTGIPRLYKAPAGCPEGEALWKQLRAEIIDHPDATLHVILVTAGCCDTSLLREAVEDKSKRTAETGQLLHLLDGLSAYARQLGVGLTIYDIPYGKTSAKRAGGRKGRGRSR